MTDDANNPSRELEQWLEAMHDHVIFACRRIIRRDLPLPTAAWLAEAMTDALGTVVHHVDALEAAGEDPRLTEAWRQLLGALGLAISTRIRAEQPAEHALN